MSRYDWESGTIVIPADQYRAFRKNMLEAWNAQEDEYLRVAEQLYASIKSKQVKRKISSFQEEESWDEYIHRLYEDSKGYEYAHRIYQLLFMKRETISKEVPGLEKPYVETRWKHLDKPQSPKKKDLMKVATSKGCALNYDECHVEFNDDKHSMSWEVYENNRAVERAHEQAYTRKLFAALRAINWKRGSGGTIVGNDEYNRDARDEGGGGNYVTHRFGPKEKQESQNTYGGGFGYGFMGSGRSY